jgi:hypothetical protein
MRVRDLWQGITLRQALKEFLTAALVVVGIWAYLWALYYVGLLG